jgi:hypothetical protein
VGSCKHGNANSGSIRGREFLDCLKDYLPLNKGVSVQRRVCELYCFTAESFQSQYFPSQYVFYFRWRIRIVAVFPLGIDPKDLNPVDGWCDS